MISRKHRFHGHGSLRYVYQRGQTVRGADISLRYVKNERQKDYRLAVVVSKKVSKSAVVRNRIRRRVYEQVRLLESAINQPYDLVFSVFKEDIASLESAKLASLIHSQLQQARVLSAASTSVRGKIDAKGD